VIHPVALRRLNMTQRQIRSRIQAR
jgi:hypothetical protein